VFVRHRRNVINGLARRDSLVGSTTSASLVPLAHDGSPPDHPDHRKPGCATSTIGAANLDVEKEEAPFPDQNLQLEQIAPVR
jgi:hypothetical protein